MMLEPDKDQRSCDRFNYPGHIVLVHVGTMRPRACLSDVADQAYEEDTEALIWIFTERGFEDRIRGRMKHAQQNRVRFVFTDEIPLTPIHTEFTEKRKFPPGGGDFWRLTSERFYYLHDLLSHLKLQVVVHIESDVMIYAPLTSLINNRRKQDKVLYPLDKSRGIASVIFFEDAKACEMLCRHGIDVPAAHDMDLLENFFKEYQGQGCASLPTIPEAVCEQLGLSKQRYSRPAEEEWGIFDAAAIGQYLFGTDGRVDTRNSLRFYNESTELPLDILTSNITCDLTHFYIIFNSVKVKINNIHVHSKRSNYAKQIIKRKFKSNVVSIAKTKEELIEEADGYLFHSAITPETSKYAGTVDLIDLAKHHQNGTTKVNRELFTLLDECTSIYCEESILTFFTDRILPHLDTELDIYVSSAQLRIIKLLRKISNYDIIRRIYAPIIDKENKKLVTIGEVESVARYNQITDSDPCRERTTVKTNKFIYPIAECQFLEITNCPEMASYYKKMDRTLYALLKTDTEGEALLRIYTEAFLSRTIIVTDVSEQTTRNLDLVSYLNDF